MWYTSPGFWLALLALIVYSIYLFRRNPRRKVFSLLERAEKEMAKPHPKLGQATLYLKESRHALGPAYGRNLISVDECVAVNKRLTSLGTRISEAIRDKQKRR